LPNILHYFTDTVAYSTHDKGCFAAVGSLHWSYNSVIADCSLLISTVIQQVLDIGRIPVA